MELFTRKSKSDNVVSLCCSKELEFKCHTLNSAVYIIQYKSLKPCFSFGCLKELWEHCFAMHMPWVGQNRLYTPYMTVYFVISLPKIPYIHCIYKYMVLTNSTYATPAHSDLNARAGHL